MKKQKKQKAGSICDNYVSSSNKTSFWTTKSYLGTKVNSIEFIVINKLLSTANSLLWFKLIGSLERALQTYFRMHLFWGKILICFTNNYVLWWGSIWRLILSAFKTMLHVRNLHANHSDTYATTLRLKRLETVKRNTFFSELKLFHSITSPANIN